MQVRARHSRAHESRRARMLDQISPPRSHRAAAAIGPAARDPTRERIAWMGGWVVDDVLYLHCNLEASSHVFWFLVLHLFLRILSL